MEWQPCCDTSLHATGRFLCRTDADRGCLHLDRWDRGAAEMLAVAARSLLASQARQQSPALWKAAQAGYAAGWRMPGAQGHRHDTVPSANCCPALYGCPQSSAAATHGVTHGSQPAREVPQGLLLTAGRRVPARCAAPRHTRLLTGWPHLQLPAARWWSCSLTTSIRPHSRSWQRARAAPSSTSPPSGAPARAGHVPRFAACARPPRASPIAAAVHAAK